ncbi:2-methylcitrate synthase [Salinisphaera sp. USBA-960]|uniref:citrate/2-methylcitrate synthase n=1 Tax=Salinisphaera orenii TaxID=856731 RepID=UPI000DBE8E50|nr:2-methylcitrate synthase [Salifodinibacter halophilus]NNC27158.1 2-methylcitrate synthase [Salifodinibacter halophilus]
MSDNTAGLAGVTAGQTAISTVGGESAGLTYRGYAIADLSAGASFEEVAHLLIHGQLPGAGELTAFHARLAEYRSLPPQLVRVLEAIPADAAPMDVLRTGVSMLGTLMSEQDEALEAATVGERLLAMMPSMLMYWHHYARGGQRIEVETDDDTIAGQFLHLLHGAAPEADAEGALAASLILYAEHEFNASTFTARVITATQADCFAAITGAIGALSGPLHGGANEQAMALIDRFADADDAERGVRERLAAKQRIMGFGHRVYRESDPRSAIIEAWAQRLAGDDPGRANVYDISKRIAEVMWRDKALFPNADFFHASAYRFLGIPTDLFTPIFVMSRLTGWIAHIVEQRADNRLIRPSADYVGPPLQTFVALDERS